MGAREAALRRREEAVAAAAQSSFPEHAGGRYREDAAVAIPKAKASLFGSSFNAAAVAAAAAAVPADHAGTCSATEDPAEEARKRYAAGYDGVGGWRTRSATEDEEKKEEVEGETYAERYARMRINSKGPDAVCTMVESDRVDKAKVIVQAAEASAEDLRERFSQPWQSGVQIEREDASTAVSQADVNAEALRRRFEDGQRLLGSAAAVEREDASRVVGQASVKAGSLRQHFEQARDHAETVPTRQTAPKAQLRETFVGRGQQDTAG